MWRRFVGFGHIHPMGRSEKEELRCSTRTGAIAYIENNRVCCHNVDCGATRKMGRLSASLSLIVVLLLLLVLPCATISAGKGDVALLFLCQRRGGSGAGCRVYLLLQSRDVLGVALFGHRLCCGCYMCDLLQHCLFVCMTGRYTNHPFGTLLSFASHVITVAS